MRKLRFPEGGLASSQGSSAAQPRCLADAVNGPVEEKRFYDALHQLTAEFDRVLAEKRDAQAENARLLEEVAVFRGCDSASLGALSPPSSPAAIRAPWPPGPGEATTASGGCAPQLAMATGLLPEPEMPPSPRPPPETPRSASKGAHGVGPAVNGVVLGAVGVAVPITVSLPVSGVVVEGSAQEKVTSTTMAGESVAPAAVEPEDLGRVSKASWSSGVSRLSDSISMFEEEEIHELEPLEVWTRTEQERGRSRRSYSSAAQSHAFESVAERRGCQRFVLRPSGRIAVTWDFFTIIILLYDLVVIPLQAYELPNLAFWSHMELIATVTWTLDICLSFWKGFEEKGNVEMRPKFIVIHYLRTWFLFDISIVAMDWVLFMFKEGDLVDWLRFSRGRRAIRLLRLARLLKHGHRLLQVFNFVKSENMLVIMRIFWLLISLVAINHFISCGWYALGMGVSGQSWAEKAFDLDSNEYDLAYRYLTSFHWAVTQFTPASMEIVPQNAWERGYNILIIFFGLLMFSSFVSNMTNSMTYLTKINYEKRQRQNIARTYITAKGVSLVLANDIMRYVTVSSNLRRSLRETDVMAFKTLPKRLIDHLRVEVHKPVVTTHALISNLRHDDPAVFARLCAHAIGERAMINGEELFHLGQKGTCMFFVTSGQLTYLFGYGETEQTPVEVGLKQWLSEACLWAHWEHRGRAVASSSACDISELNAVEFQGMVMRCLIVGMIQQYAASWAKAASYESGGKEHISDIWGQRLRVSDLVQKVFNIEEDNEAQKLVRIMGGNEFGIERIFKAWAKHTEQIREEKRLNELEEKRKRVRRRGSFQQLPVDGPVVSRHRSMRSTSSDMHNSMSSASPSKLDVSTEKTLSR